MIPDNTIQLIRNTAKENIVDVIGDFVALKKRGSQYFGLSPFNNERTPSFTIHPSKGIFKDFSSGKGGDVIEFIMEACNFKFDDAVRYLGKKFNIDMDKDIAYIIPDKKVIPELPTSYIPRDDFFTGGYQEGALYKFLSDKVHGLDEIFNIYHIAGIKDWIIFWQVDTNGLIRSGKYIKYQDNGKRCKEQNASWHHTKTKEYSPIYPYFNLKQCFFGEHLLLTDVRKPVAVVESEKTAIIATYFLPQYIWLSCGSKHGINEDKVQVLANRSVTLFPDIGCYNEWKITAKKFNFNVSDKIEKYRNEMTEGLDLADFLL